MSLVESILGLSSLQDQIIRVARNITRSKYVGDKWREAECFEAEMRKEHRGQMPEHGQLALRLAETMMIPPEVYQNN